MGGSPPTSFPGTGVCGSPNGLLDLSGSAEEEIPYSMSQTLQSLSNLSFHPAVTTVKGGCWVCYF